VQYCKLTRLLSDRQIKFVRLILFSFFWFCICLVRIYCFTFRSRIFHLRKYFKCSRWVPSGRFKGEYPASLAPLPHKIYANQIFTISDHRENMIIWIWNQELRTKNFTRFWRYYYILSNPNMTDYLRFSINYITSLGQLICSTKASFDWQPQNCQFRKTHSDIYTSVLRTNSYSFWALAYTQLYLIHIWRFSN
jgi:hypothetical protein